MLKIIFNLLWPKLKDEKNARMASHHGFIIIAAIFLPVFIQMISGPWRIDHIIFILGAVSLNIFFCLALCIPIYFCSRIGSLILIAILIWTDVFVLTMSISSPVHVFQVSVSLVDLTKISFLIIINLLLYLFSLNSIRGSFAFNRMKKMKELGNHELSTGNIKK